MDIPIIDRVSGMESGVVFNFSNRTFANYFHEEFRVDVYDDRWVAQGNSKANRRRSAARSTYRSGRSLRPSRPSARSLHHGPAGPQLCLRDLSERHIRRSRDVRALLFRLRGEQIDGGDQAYLLEARWKNTQVDVATLHAFNGKAEGKASFSMC